MRYEKNSKMPIINSNQILKKYKKTLQQYIKTTQMIQQSNFQTKQQKKLKSQKLQNPSQTQFQIKQIIGRGTFGTVYLAHWLPQNIKVAIKSIIKNPKFKNRQVQILSSLKHQSIVQLFVHYQKYDQNEKKLYINLIMEYLPNTLLTIIRSANAKHNKLDLSKIIMFSRKLLQGLAYLQEKGICHRDIKPSNLLIDQNANRLKICDFGSAKQLKKGQKSITYICSRYYRAPELILGCSEYCTKIDIWSAGCVIAQMLTLHPLFDGNNNLDQITKIVKILGPPTKQDLNAMKIHSLDQDIDEVVSIGLFNKIKKSSTHCTNQFIDLLQKLIVYDPSKRLSAKQALNHQVFSV